MADNSVITITKALKGFSGMYDVKRLPSIAPIRRAGKQTAFNCIVSGVMDFQ